MNEPSFGHWVAAMVTVAAGAMVAAIGFRILGRPGGENRAYDAWHDKYGGWLRAGGIFLMVWGAVRFFM